MSVYVSTIAIWGRRVDSAVAATATTFQRLKAQSSNLYRSVVGIHSTFASPQMTTFLMWPFLVSTLYTSPNVRCVEFLDIMTARHSDPYGFAGLTIDILPLSLVEIFLFYHT